VLAAEEMLIDTPHLRTTAPGQLRDSLLNKRLVPALDCGATNAVRGAQFALAHAAVMGLKHFQPVRFGRATTRINPRKTVSNVAIAGGAVLPGTP